MNLPWTLIEGTDLDFNGNPYHYIEIKPDFSDLKERIAYYLGHPKEAEAIVRHAHEYINQFRNRKREDLISYLVLQKYFDITNA
jgi:hypothetical protein